MFAIFKKEMRSYFINPIGYVFVGIFLALSALLCCYTTIQSNSYSTSAYFTIMIFALVILIPLLTRRSFAEERKLKTEQLLLTAPVTIWGMTLGKFFAAFTIFFGSLLTSCINFFPLYTYANQERAAAEYSVIHIGPSTARIIGCLIGVTLIGAAFIAIGMFVSSLTENQLASAVITISIIIFMLLLNLINPHIDSYAVRVVIDWFCVLSRFAAFTNGYIDYAAII